MPRAREMPREREREKERCRERERKREERESYRTIYEEILIVHFKCLPIIVLSMSWKNIQCINIQFKNNLYAIDILIIMNI